MEHIIIVALEVEADTLEAAQDTVDRVMDRMVAREEIRDGWTPENVVTVPRGITPARATALLEAYSRRVDRIDEIHRLLTGNPWT